jgi:hypothetical protein
MSIQNDSNFTGIETDGPTQPMQPYRWFPDDTGVANPICEEHFSSENNGQCEECSGLLNNTDFEIYCENCGLIHDHRIFWHTSLEIEAERRLFDHNSENGSGTLQDQHVVAIEDSVASTFFDGNKLHYWVFPLDQYNDGRDGHRGREDGHQKLNREDRFLKGRSEACASTVGFTGAQVQEVARLVKTINSGAFTAYGPTRKGGGQDAHIAAAIAYVGNKNITNLDDRVESRDDFQSFVSDIGMNRENVRSAVSQLHKQLNK